MEEVFAKIKNGDQGAFEQVFRMFYIPLCDYAVMILGDQAEAGSFHVSLEKSAGGSGAGVREILSFYFGTFPGFKCVET